MLLIAEEDPAAHDVRSLLHEHLEFCRSVTPPEHVHALGVSGLIDPLLTVFGARQDGKLLGIAALKHLDASHAEVKSMHTREDARGQGVGWARRSSIGCSLSPPHAATAG
jgi:putative acetyltransferase